MNEPLYCCSGQELMHILNKKGNFMLWNSNAHHSEFSKKIHQNLSDVAEILHLIMFKNTEGPK